ncbi:hypothetical protein ACQ4WX_00550 [Streptomyces lasalocidi]
MRGGVHDDGLPERGPVGFVEAGALEELLGLQRGQLLLTIGQEYLGDALVGQRRPPRFPLMSTTVSTMYLRICGIFAAYRTAWTFTQ